MLGLGLLVVGRLLLTNPKRSSTQSNHHPYFLISRLPSQSLRFAGSTSSCSDDKFEASSAPRAVEGTASTSTAMTAVGDVDSMDAGVGELAEFIRSRSHLVLLTGAGVSTSAGIPDYRGPTGSYSRGHKPMLHRDFVELETARRRYWARSMLGWRLFADSQPTYAHRAFAQLEAEGLLRYTITQNVDRLHQRGGARHVLDLHGRNDRVVCLSCGYNGSRRLVQSQLDLLNPRLAAKFRTARADDRLRADGDAEVDAEDDLQLAIPCCPRCGGVLKPEVVYFGDSLPPAAVQSANTQVDACDGLLVAGSSLEVFSAYRLVARAAARGVPVAVLNRGPTRAERSGLPLLLKLDAPVDDAMRSVMRALRLHRQE